MVDIINCFYCSISYPYYTNNGLPEFPHGTFFALWFSETLMFIDIILNFFKQGLDEQGNSLYDPLSEVATRYLHSDFCIELIAFIPWGYLLGLIDHKLKIFWLVKAIRIGQLNHYMKDRSILPIINYQIDKYEKKFLEDKDMYDDII